MLGVVAFGIASGILLSSTFGTVFFSLIQTSVDAGFRNAIKIAFGVFICDLVFAFFAIFGTTMLPHIENFQKWMAGIGIIFLLTLGVLNIFKKQPKLAYPSTRLGNFLYYFSSGFLLNGLNPVNFITWVTLATYIRTSLKYDFSQVLVFFGVSVVTVFLMECLIGLFARKFQKVFTPRRIMLFNKITGVVFIFIAAQLFYKVFMK